MRDRALQTEKRYGTYPFSLFENEELKIRLILTGAGNIAAACAVSGTFGEFPPGKGDFLVNIGSAAAMQMIRPCGMERSFSVIRSQSRQPDGRFTRM